MNNIIDLHKTPKGSPCEIKGEIVYENPPKPSRYGKGLNQFIVVQDNLQDRLSAVGVNINVASVEEGFQKGEKVLVRGKVDKYPDKTQQLNPDGTYPMKTSVKADYIERFVEPEDFPTESPSSPTPVTGFPVSVMSADDVKAANTPRPVYVDAKAEEKAMWAKKDLIVAKQSACKTVGKWISDGKIELKDYFGWCTRLVDYFYNEDDKFAVITEANLMVSKLVNVTKTQALAWIEKHLKGTDVEQDPCGILHVKELDKQTLDELLKTIEKLSLIL